jgi:hypothetical protein
MAFGEKLAAWVKGVVKGIPVIIRKIGCVFLFVYWLGMISGFLLASGNYNPLVLAMPFLGLLVMWYDLDQGLLVLLLMAVAVWAFPEVFLVY